MSQLSHLRSALLSGLMFSLVGIGCSSGGFQASSKAKNQSDEKVGASQEAPTDASSNNAIDSLEQDVGAIDGTAGLPGDQSSGDIKAQIESKENGEMGEGPGQGGNGNSQVVQTSDGLTEAVFPYGPLGSLADFVFVFDNSVSMDLVLPAVQAGFLSLTQAEWPKDSRVAFMTTMPGDPNNLDVVHPLVKEYSGINKEPGFLSFVNQAAVSRFVQAASEKKGSYKDPVCSESWFEPLQKNSQGKPCLAVALQNPFTAVGVEAGLVSFGQILRKTPQLFRRGSNVQVVFVSDTNDPGKGGDIKSLLDIRPGFAELKKKAFENSKIVGIRLHGITPGEGCETSEGIASSKDIIRGLSYKNVIKESGGTWLNICEGKSFRKDFRPVAQQIIKGALPEPVFLLPMAAKEVVRVEVAGQPYPLEKVSLGPDSVTVRIEGLAPTSDVKVAIQFE